MIPSLFQGFRVYGDRWDSKKLPCFLTLEQYLPIQPAAVDDGLYVFEDLDSNAAHDSVAGILTHVRELRPSCSPSLPP